MSDWSRSQLPRPDEWTIKSRFSKSRGHSLDLSHPLSLGISWSDSSLTTQSLDEVRSRYEQRLSTHPEIEAVRAAPRIRHPELVMSLRQLIGSRLWTPDEVYDLCSTLAWHKVITPSEGEWLTWFCSEGAPMKV